jgi:DNA repair exonuclease SbcCD ATPase subunit
MIILKHLTIERFRLLRSMNLHFPQRGSILIQGPNEAGKSALIESIYFVLYGETLAARRGNRSLDDLILYGAASAVVSLTLSVGTSELTITRTIERGNGQQASLLVQQLGSPDEPALTDLVTVNERIITILGKLDGTTLRDSGLIEQKGLTRLETISESERETTIRNLQGLDIVTELLERFQISPEDDQRLNVSSERLTLAEVQAHIPQVRTQLAQLEEALDAVQVHDYLAGIEQQELEIGELEQALEDIHSKRLELKSRQGRIQQLKKADATLSEIIASYDDIADAHRELPALEQQIADLERREREELPKIEKRVSDLAELTRSFGTLQRMSNDLLTAVESIKELEQDQHEHNEVKQNLRLLNEQVAQSRSHLRSTQKSWQDLEDQRRIQRPRLEDRLKRLLFLSERLAHLTQLEKNYTRRVSGQSLAEENESQLRKIMRDLEDTENERELGELEAKRIQQQADDLEKIWRQLSIRRQVEEWYRLKGLSQGLTQAEQHVNQALQQQSVLTGQAVKARGLANRSMGFMSLCGAIIFLLLIGAWIVSSTFVALTIVCFAVCIVLIIPIFLFWRAYSKAHTQELAFKQQEQDALGRVSMMVAAREAAMRIAGSEEVIQRVENEIRSLGGTIPQSLEDAQAFLDRTRDQSNPDEAQQSMKSKQDEANVAHNQVNAIMESVTALRKERARLEEQRKQEQWDNLEQNLFNDQSAVELMHQEITLLAGQENLPLPSINARIQASPVPSLQSFGSGALPIVDLEEDNLVGMPALEDLIESTIKATEHEISSLDGKLDMSRALANQAKEQQAALDTLLVRQNAVEDRDAQFQMNNPEQQVEHAREQQMALRGALQSLQDSLRQRVKPLGVAFGQTAVGTAENVARKQLEELHITLGKKVMFQESYGHYTELLNNRQEALSEHYKQLAKFSNTLGSWIVPLNPFAEALIALRTRCQKELLEANEGGILQELESLQGYEGASLAKIQLCQQEILGGQESISAILILHGCPDVTSYAPADLILLWPLLGNYTLEDRDHLEDEYTTCQQDLNEQEQREQSLSQKLGSAGELLDLEQTRAQMEKEDRSYQTKKHGHLLVQEAEQRLLSKILPRTEYYMQQILPLLTGGRYNDVHLITENVDNTSNSGAFQIQVWDTAAGEYVPTSVLSGGAADLLSLALRLAFAIATLPRDLNAAPGFVLLDEPLSSFDRGRAQALVDVVTGDVLSQHFEQIILLSHSDAFDPAMFPYHLYMDNGLMVESNLPIVPAAITPVAGALSNDNQAALIPDDDDFADLDDFDDFAPLDEHDRTVAVAAVKLPSNNK